MKSLTELVHELPPELFDESKELTCTLDKEEIAIDHDFKPPVQLQINRTIRESFANKFCANNTFIIPGKDDIHDIKALAWLRSLKKTSFALFNSVKYRPSRTFWENDPVDVAYADLLSSCRAA